MSSTQDVRVPISEHGAIGDTITLALVGTRGTIDFMCWPCFDSPSIFARLLGDANGGAFELAPDIADANVVQSYLPETNVLVTRWLGNDASVDIVDCMVAPSTGRSRLIRRVSVTRGRATIALRCAPRFDYARVRPAISLAPGEAIFSAADCPSLRLRGDVAFSTVDDGVNATFELGAGDVRDFVFDGTDSQALAAAEVAPAILATTSYWQAWSAQSTYRGRWRSSVMRSALVLKLLTSERHGSIVAAGTFGLPETPGGERNWDYRATWVRDASFTIYGLMRLGHIDEAMAFTRWSSKRAEECPEGRLEVMYALGGGDVPAEETLDHLAGYGGARPVRIGNAAATQVQLDIYGALLDSLYLSNKYGEAISHNDWDGVCRLVEYVCAHWESPDAGIWESRAEPHHHLHSRVMCWVAVDRAIRLAQKRSLNAPFARWAEARNAINADIWANFWNGERGHFVHTKGGTELDGALLMMPLVRFVSATDPRWLATLDAIGETLGDGGFITRYRAPDGLAGEEGSFAACAFWYVECLARAGRLDEARANFERLLTYGNHLRLYAEEFSPRAHLRGNFPQALTHLALISAAFYLDRAIDKPDGGQWRA